VADDFKAARLKTEIFRSPVHCAKWPTTGLLYVLRWGNNRVQICPATRDGKGPAQTRRVSGRQTVVFGARSCCSSDHRAGSVGYGELSGRLQSRA